MSNIESDSSRCARLRSGSQACDHCVSSCPNNAIAVETSVVVDTASCMECGCCVASCPTEALRFRGSKPFGRLVAMAARRSRCVLGCRKSTVQGHLDAGPCLGWLSEEELCALGSVAREGMQLDLTQCEKCENAHIPAILEERLTQAAGKTGLPVLEMILAVRDPGKIWQSCNTVGRRQFFKFWKEMLEPELEGFPTGNPPQLSYGQQVLPLKRQILQWLAEKHGQEFKTCISNNYFSTIEVSDACDGCGSCEAVCPSGALEQADEDSPPAITPAKCVGCGACEPFCDASAIRLLSPRPITGLAKAF